jgi:ferredoxin-NADP reductase
MSVTKNLSSSGAWTESLVAPLRSVLLNPWVESIVRLSAVNDTLGGLHPMLSLSEVRVRVVRVIDESVDTKTFVLQPNSLWKVAKAGQFVRLRLEMDGRRVERVYSLSSRPGARRLAITVRRQGCGLVSNYLHSAVKAGDVLTISQAAGDFVLPTQLAQKMLLLSAGSGITPVMAMLRDLQARNFQGDLIFFHVCRTPEDFIFSQQLQTIAAAFPALKLIVHYSHSAGRFGVDMLKSTVPDLTERETWVCAPRALMDAVHQLWDDANINVPLHSERFAAPAFLPTTAVGTPVAVEFVASGKTFVTSGCDPLLVQAERAGLAPKHGCRIGICRSCQCTKTRGTVENLQTGEISSTPNELIRLCISAARSDVALDL